MQLTVVAHAIYVFNFVNRAHCYGQKRGLGLYISKYSLRLRHAMAAKYGFVQQINVLTAALQWPLNYIHSYKGSDKRHQ